MTPVRFIRKTIFDLTQAQFGQEFGVTQGAVAAWESAGRFPTDVQEAVRTKARERCQALGIEWSDSWFFDVPDDLPVPKAA